MRRQSVAKNKRYFQIASDKSDETEIRKGFTASAPKSVAERNVKF